MDTGAQDITYKDSHLNKDNQRYKKDPDEYDIINDI